MDDILLARKNSKLIVSIVRNFVLFIYDEPKVPSRLLSF